MSLEQQILDRLAALEAKPRAVDTPITLRDLLPSQYVEKPSIDMSFDEYAALPGGYHASNERNGGKVYRFVGHPVGSRIGIPMLSRWIGERPAGGGDDGTIVMHEHTPVTLNGQEVVLRQKDISPYGTWIWALPDGRWFALEYSS